MGDETGHIMMEKTLIGEEATLLYLIRHGMTGDNLNGVLQGSRDVPPGEAGTAAMDRIVSKNRGRDIAVVSHGFAIELYLGYARHVPFDLIENYIVENCAVSTLTYDAAGQVTLLRVNDVSHLPDSLRFHTEERFSSRV